METLIIAIVFLGILIVGHELGHFTVAKWFKLKVEEFGFGFPPRLLKKKIGETVYTLNAIPFGGFVKIYGEDHSEEILEKERSFESLPASKKSLIVAAGAIMNFIIGWFAISMVFMIGVAPTVFIGQVSKESPAALVGLKEGDELKGFNNVSEFTSFVNQNRGNEIDLNVVRENRKLIIKAIPRVNPPLGEGPLGVSLIDGGIPKHSITEALYEGGKASLKILGTIFVNLFKLVTGLLTGNWQATAGVTGPIGIFNFLGTASKLGVVYLLQILSLISLNLTAINMIPFPALDGGRLFFILYEKLSGSKLNYKVQAIAHTVGFAILILLMVIVTVKDIINLI